MVRSPVSGSGPCRCGIVPFALCHALLPVGWLAGRGSGLDAGVDSPRRWLSYSWFSEASDYGISPFLVHWQLLFYSLHGIGIVLAPRYVSAVGVNADAVFDGVGFPTDADSPFAGRTDVGCSQVGTPVSGEPGSGAVNDDEPGVALLDCPIPGLFVLVPRLTVDGDAGCRFLGHNLSSFF